MKEKTDWKPAGRLALSRRTMLVGTGGALFIAGAELGLAREVIKAIEELQPGEYTWHPERSPEGPVAIVVSLPEQRVHVYRNGVRIAVSTCSSGKPGHETPTGIFTILEKDKHHHSSTYNNAPMPNMNRLTWQGVALHAGNLPGYPASHGCVRLPLDFSEKLFTVTHVGTPVIISGTHSDPYELTHPGMILGDYSVEEMESAISALKAKSHPKDWGEGEVHSITSVIASSGDGSITLFENGKDIAKGKLAVKGSPRLGEHVFTLQTASNGQMYWHGISHHPDPAAPMAREENLINRISADKAFVSRLRDHMHPGMMMIVSDIPSHPDRRSGEDFVIMTVS